MTITNRNFDTDLEIAVGTIQEFRTVSNFDELIERFLNMRDELISTRQLLAKYQSGEPLDAD